MQVVRQLGVYVLCRYVGTYVRYVVMTVQMLCMYVDRYEGKQVCRYIGMYVGRYVIEHGLKIFNLILPNREDFTYQESGRYAGSQVCMQVCMYVGTYIRYVVMMVQTLCMYVDRHVGMQESHKQVCKYIGMFVGRYVIQHGIDL